MSYILDALRRSDQHRRRGAVPGLRAPQASSTAPVRRASTSHILLAMALLGAGIAIGALRPWQSGEPPVASESASAKAPESVPPKPSEAVLAEPIPTESLLARRSERDRPAEKPAQEAAVSHAPAAIPRKDSAAKPAKKAQARASPPVAATTTKTAGTASSSGANSGDDAGRDPKVLEIAELPLSIRQEIPQVAISVHAYSDVPERRLISVEERMLREGEPVARGLVLEQITPDGVILRYKDYRFRRGVR